jgi:tetratricopeptide (TPR) repeat protein
MKYEEALFRFDLANRAHPHGSYVISQALALFKMGQHKEAMAMIVPLCCAESDVAAVALATLSWCLATCPDDEIRNGKRALAEAQRANSLSDNWVSWSSLAAAHAELGQFEEAVRFAKKAFAAAPTVRTGDMQHRVSVYESGVAYRDTGMVFDGLP